MAQVGEDRRNAGATIGRIDDSAAVDNRVEQPTAWGNVHASDLTLQLAQTLQRKGVDGIELAYDERSAWEAVARADVSTAYQTFKPVPPTEANLSLSPEAKEIFERIKDSAEMEMLQRACDPQHQWQSTADGKLTVPLFVIGDLYMKLASAYCLDYVNADVRKKGKFDILSDDEISQTLEAVADAFLDPENSAQAGENTAPWRTVEKTSLKFFIAKSLKERGVKGINFTSSGKSDPLATISLSTQAETSLRSLLRTPEIIALQRVADADKADYTKPNFDAVTLPALQDPELQARLTALHLVRRADGFSAKATSREKQAQELRAKIANGHTVKSGDEAQAAYLENAAAEARKKAAQAESEGNSRYADIEPATQPEIEDLTSAILDVQLAA